MAVTCKIPTVTVFFKEQTTAGAIETLAIQAEELLEKKYEKSPLWYSETHSESKHPCIKFRLVECKQALCDWQQGETVQKIIVDYVESDDIYKAVVTSVIFSWD